MPPAATPFVPLKVKCPVCEAESEQRYLKAKMFSAQVTEEDQHVVVYKWEDQAYAHLRPNFYHLWHCPRCHFTEEKELFRGEIPDPGKMELIRDKVLLISKIPGSILKRLGTAAPDPMAEFTVEDAIVLHLLAIHIQEMLSPNMRQLAKVARFTLRLAWLFRERSTLGLPPAPPPAGFESFDAFLASFKQEWADIPLDEDTTLDRAIAGYTNDMNARRTEDPRYMIGVLNLLANLHRRRGRPGEALACLRTVFSTATRARQAAKAIQQKGGPGSEKAGALAGWLSGAIDKTKEDVDHLQEQILKDELPRAKEAVMAMGAKVTAEAVLARLRELKFADVTCRKVAAMFGGAK